MEQLIEGVEAPKDRIIKFEEVLDILVSRGISSNALKIIKKYLRNNKVIDVSGFSGASTILVIDKSKSYLIKVSEKRGELKNEKELLSLFSKYNYTEKVLEYIQDNFDILITNFIHEPLAVAKHNTPEELAHFMGKSLRNFHDTKWDTKNFNEKQLQILKDNREKIYNTSLKHKVGLKFIADYQNDHNYEGMKEYIKNNYKDYNQDEVIIHGDYNPKNVFSNNNFSPLFVDVTDSSFGDRHYDIYWTMWTISLYLGVQTDPDKVKICEDVFLNSYGREVIDDKRLSLCKKLNCMYWQESENIKYFGRK